MDGTDIDTSKETPSVTACDQKCLLASLALGTISLIIVAIALASLFVAWRCRERRQIGGAVQGVRTFDIIATSVTLHVESESDERNNSAIDAV